MLVEYFAAMGLGSVAIALLLKLYNAGMPEFPAPPLIDVVSQVVNGQESPALQEFVDSQIAYLDPFSLHSSADRRSDGF